MYHFVRDLKHSRYPEIKGLSFNEFREQVEYLIKYYNIIKIEDVLQSIGTKGVSLPPRAALLTFDDGYVDHFTNVFPVLDANGIQGCFFPPAKSITENQVLDVNKIHFILACVSDRLKIVDYVLSKIESCREEFCLRDPRSYYRELAVPNRFDTAEVVFIKRVLQRGLPEDFRKKILDELFTNYVSSNEGAFSRELYMNIDQLKCMKRNGMFIGSHGYDHYWLDTLDKEAQEKEIDLSLEFLQEVGCDMSNWVICYPYGAHNDALVALLKTKGCRLGFTTEVRIANLNSENPLLLPRLDTNDLPKNRNAEANGWTRKMTKPGDLS